MKLEEIVEEQFKINLTEVLNTEINTKWTIDNDGNKIGRFTSGEHEYQIRLDLLPIKELEVFHISFQIWNQELKEWSHKATLNNKQSAAIIGAIFNAIKNEIPNFRFDGLVFGAIDHTDKRMRIYNFIMRRYMKYLGGYIDNLPGPNGSLWTIVCTNAVSRNYTKQEIMDIAYPYLNK